MACSWMTVYHPTMIPTAIEKKRKKTSKKKSAKTKISLDEIFIERRREIRGFGTINERGRVEEARAAFFVDLLMIIIIMRVTRK